MPPDIDHQEKVKLLTDIEFLHGLDAAVLERIARLSTSRVWKPNINIFYEGDRGDAMYCILSGEVHVYKTTDCGTNIPVVTLGAGAFFGHLSLLDRQARSASIRTTCETRLLETRHSDFQQLLKENPGLYMNILGGLCGMLHEKR